MTTRISRTLATALSLACAIGAVSSAHAGLVTTNYSNAATIAIPDSGASTPSPIPVSGLSGTITRVTVTLNGFQHTYTSDVDVMMRAPGGQQIMLMSDAGSSADGNNATLVFDASSMASLTSGQIVSGTYQPTDITDGLGTDAFPAAPVGAPTTDLTTLNGDATAQNGIWQLFVNDDAGGDSGQFTGGWTLSITRETFTSCSAEGYTGAKLTLCRQVCEIEQSPSRFASLFKLYTTIYRSTPPCAD